VAGSSLSHTATTSSVSRPRGIRSLGFHAGASELDVGIGRQGAPIIDALDRRSFSEVEMPLDGGASTPGVVRVGEIVRRPMNANSGYVHALLLHLERCGFAGAPRYLGVDRQGREILTYIHGFAPPHPGFELTEAAVRAGARLVRDVHDLTEATPFAAGSEVACHRNLSQPNFIFRDMIPVAIIDWDTTRPGSRVANLGEFLWAFVHPALYGDGEPALRMVRAAVGEYGYQGPGLVEAMLAPSVRGFGTTRILVNGRSTSSSTWSETPRCSTPASRLWHDRIPAPLQRLHD
jgi:hypothetical protein